MLILGFEYPDDCFYFLEEDMWCRLLEDGRMQVGATAFGVHLSGDLYMCRPKSPGTFVEQGGTLGVVELSKAVVAIRSPLSGHIHEVNPLLEETPEVINKEPYGKGWIVTMTPARWEQDLLKLARGAGLEALAKARMRRENVNLPPD